LAKIMLERPISKWQVFAREFIVHLENSPDTRCNPTITMRHDQIEFIENNLSKAREIEKLADCYVENLRLELSERMRKEFPTKGQFNFRNEPQNGFFSEGIDIAKAKVTLFFKTAFHKSGIPDEKKFQVSIGLDNLSEAQKKSMTDIGLIWDPTERGWAETKSFDDRVAAMGQLCMIAKKVFDALEK